MTRAPAAWRLGAAMLATLPALAFPPATVNAQSADGLSLPIGAQRVLDLPAAVTRIVIADAGIIDASVQDDHRVQITGMRPGRTNLAIFTTAGGTGAAYSVVVGSPGGGGGGTPTVRTGTLTSALAAQPDLAGVRAATTPAGKTVLTGKVDDLQAHAKAVDIAKAYGTDNVADLTQVTGDQMVAVEIRFAAVDANTVNELGFNFQSLGQGFQIASAAPNTLTSTLNAAAGLSSLATGLPIASAFNLLLGSPKSNILGVLSALNGSGLAEILAEPTLTVKSGEHASFLAGGEVPIPVPQSGSSAGAVTIEYHTYGVKLDIAPTVLSDHRIAMRVAPEVSQIDTANALSIQGYSVPAFRRRSTSTTVELGDGQSFVIAGLIYNNNSVTENKLPFLGDLPIIGAFFKITQNQRERQELIVVATPHLVRPLDGGQLPPLPGQEASAYNPKAGDILLGTKPLDQAITGYGLIR